MDKIKEAVKKINTEVQKDPNNQYVAMVGEHIIDQIQTEEAAEKVLQAGKTLAEAMKEIEGKARRRAIRNAAYVADDEVYSWARDYFGLTEQAKPQTVAEVPKKEETKGIHLDLADFM